jgi:hypothetical protein
MLRSLTAVFVPLTSQSAHKSLQKASPLTRAFPCCLNHAGGELNAAMNMILEGKAPDNDPKTEWDGE